MPRRFFKTPRHFSLNAVAFSESLKILFPQFSRHTKQIAFCLQVWTIGSRMGIDVFASHKFPFAKKNFIFTPEWKNVEIDICLLFWALMPTLSNTDTISSVSALTPSPN